MSPNSETMHESSRYSSLGLIANPFAATVTTESTKDLGHSLELSAAANRLLVAIADVARSGNTRPIVVNKSTDVPGFYHLRAISMVEAELINDEALNILHGYVQLYMMRRGRVRSTLAALGERLTFRSFDTTLALYIEQVLAEPDEELASYQVLGPEKLAAFAEQFSADPLAVFAEYFGEEELERRPELAEVADLRLANLDVDAEETDVDPELDAAMPDAPGTGIALPAEREGSEERQAVVDYLIEYTAKHLSPVVARCMRIYRERGLAAASMELRITKAPRKTLKAVVRLARGRFDRVALIYDGFESWTAMPPDMRQSVVSTMSELRWMLDGDVVIAFLLERGLAPELEEAFAGGTQIAWDFRWLEPLQKDSSTLVAEMVDEWLAAAALPGAAVLSLQDPVLARIAEKAEGSLPQFASMAFAAIESAAGREALSLDDEAYAAAEDALKEA